MKRVISFKAATVMLMALMLVTAGCGNSSSSNSGTAANAGTAEGGSAKPAIEKPRVAFVYIGPPGDGGWTYEHDNGRKYMEEQTGIKADTVENVPESADAERIITELAQDHDLIFTTSFGYMDYTLNVAKKFPNVIFEHAAGYKTADNMGTYFGRNYEASYLSGIAAGKMTKKNLIGYVGAFPIPEVIYNLNAFALGAQSVNPDAKVSVIWSNTWYDPTAERQAAVSLLDKGADVLLAYQDSPATIQAAAERGAFAGGNDSDMSRFAPDSYLTNPTWNWGPYYTKVVKSVMDGTWKSDSYMGDIKDGMVGLAPLGAKIPDDVKKMVEDAKGKLLDGTLDVFAGPLADQSGAAKVEQGKSLSLDEILAMDWLVKGVDGTIPK
ncbi:MULTISPECIES: BMP family ABC transporter substrate-binding protein [unclassified Paenibacillus]|uniref:BMP family ABC transporter substrate-binding protein n=1 Tax=unclassified Paenibacillus TaxID=185978 RepID=UPI0009566517|nr:MULTISPECIES: BMP family ABC transporter substrate-binding protein [unclassified Paenibacillus]ASS66835.1 BMP family ABC transporter substrate-binding protein [Paenibacillus sp. RUD330]SIP93880.1 basic membrane protein A [Paenibacillus sp. RU4X]SIQ12399.1 basic membrane protein A [Paenibacillus sp. RU4T]